MVQLQKYTKAGNWSPDETREFKNIIIEMDIPDEIKGKKYAAVRKVFKTVSNELTELGYPGRTEIELLKKYKEIRAEYQQKNNSPFNNINIFQRIYSYLFTSSKLIENANNNNNETIIKSNKKPYNSTDFNNEEILGSESQSVISDELGTTNMDENYFDDNKLELNQPKVIEYQKSINNINKIHNKNRIDKLFDNLEETMFNKNNIVRCVDKSTNVGVKTRWDDTNSYYILRNIDPELGIYRLCSIDPSTFVQGKY